MQIYVNEQELDAELTGEKNLQQIYEAVSDWIADHKRYILGLKVDSTDVSLSSLNAIEASGVQRVDFYVGDELDMVLTTVGELDRYVDQIGATLYEIDSVGPEDADNLREGIQWIRQILHSFSSILSLDLSAMSVLVPGSQGSEAIDRIIERLEKRVDRFAQDNGRAAIEDFLEDLRSFKFFVMKLYLQLRTMSARSEDLIAMVDEFEKRIPEIVQETASINASFNAGKDFTALETLDRTTGVLNEYIAALYALDYQLKKSRGRGFQEIEVGGVSFFTAASELTALLKDLSSALEENDIVATGDILEYELTEKLSALAPYLTEIRRFTLAGKA